MQILELSLTEFWLEVIYIVLLINSVLPWDTLFMCWPDNLDSLINMYSIFL